MKLKLNIPNIDYIEIDNTDEAIELLNKIANLTIEKKIKEIDNLLEDIEDYCDELTSLLFSYYVQHNPIWITSKIS